MMMCNVKQFNKVQGFTQLCTAQKSISCMATTTPERKVEVSNRENSLFNGLLENVSDASCLGGRGGKSLMSYWHCSC